MGIDESKKETRSRLRKIWTWKPDQEIAQISAEIKTGLMKSELWQNAEILLAFLSFGREITLDDLILQSIQAGKKVFTPRVEGKVINFYRILSLNESGLEVSSMGIREPSVRNEQFIPDDETETLVLVPGLGFTTDGKRMGRGGGYYDRFLGESSWMMNLTTVGICSSWAILEELPVEDHDMKVEYLCSENGLLKATL